MTEAYLGLGSNIGDKAANIRRAAALLKMSDGIRNVELSPLYRTKPIGKIDQDWFVNAAARLETSLDPKGLLHVCLEAERSLKRIRSERWGPRTLDVDILLFGDEKVAMSGLEVPHPRMAERAFALAPLRDLAPGLRIDGVPVQERLEALRDQGVERLESKVAIIGASEKPDRYANRAQRMLTERGYSVLPVSPTGKAILGVEGARRLDECAEDVDTVTLYVGSARVESVIASILKKSPRRVIFNPGTENAAAKRQLREAGIEALEACTLVMLATGRF